MLIKETGTEPCHAFLVPFYGAHLRLVLFSIPLESSLASTTDENSFDKRALWLSFSSATDMLNLVADPAIQSFLYFAQDSIHVMTAYAAVLLVKVSLRPTFNNLLAPYDRD